MVSTDTPMEDVSDTDVVGFTASDIESSCPSVGVIRSSRQYLHEDTIRRKLARVDLDPSRDEASRLQGVQLIDDVRNALRLYVHYPHPLHSPNLPFTRVTIMTTDANTRIAVLSPLLLLHAAIITASDLNSAPRTTSGMMQHWLVSLWLASRRIRSRSLEILSVRTTT